MDLRHCRLRDKQQDRLAEFFVAGVTARTAAELLGIHRNTAAYFYHRLREIIAKQLEKNSPLAGQIEVDESYFGGHRKGKHGRGAAGKVPVFGLLKRGGRVYTAIIPDTWLCRGEISASTSFCPCRIQQPGGGSPSDRFVAVRMPPSDRLARAMPGHA